MPARLGRLLPELFPMLLLRADGEAPRAHDEGSFFYGFDAPRTHGEQILCLPHLDHKRLVHVAAPAHQRRIRVHDLLDALDHRCEKLRSNTASAMRFLRISIEPPAIIQPRQRRRQYSTSSSWL